MSDLKSYWQDKYPSAFCWSFGDSPALADELAASLTPNVVVTGLQLDKYIACAGAARWPAISRSSRP